MIVAIADLGVEPGREEEWERLWSESIALAKQQAGFVSALLLRSTQERGKYLIEARLQDRQSWEAFQDNEELQRIQHRMSEVLKKAHQPALVRNPPRAGLSPRPKAWTCLASVDSSCGRKQR